MLNSKDTYSSENKSFKSLIMLLFSRASTALSMQMVTVAVGWQMYSITKSTFYLGLVGLMEFIPMIILTIFIGYAADHFDRKKMIFFSQIIGSASILILAFGSYHGWIDKNIILILIFLIGVCNSIQGPPLQALLPNVVEKEKFPKAAALSSSVFQIAVILGPCAGGFLYPLGAYVVYFIAAFLLLISAFNILFIKVRNEQVKSESVTIKSLLTGLSFIKSRPIILGAMSMDLFAVLFGGATALIPVFASDVFKIGPWGFGVLRAAPAVGALIMSIILAINPLKKKVGHIMYAAVIMFGITTILFAISRSFILSILILCIMGASDVISVVIRSTLVQLNTPDEMRGRVSSVNQMFVGTSNQLGEFESGLTASWFGAVPAVLIGGIGTVVVVLSWIKLFPQLFNVDKMTNKKS
ncbi:MAG: MFS transporter [Bacillota bacterium]|nr:MFS transporter [Bacillota bacterium]